MSCQWGVSRGVGVQPFDDPRGLRRGARNPFPAYTPCLRMHPPDLAHRSVSQYLRRVRRGDKVEENTVGIPCVHRSNRARYGLAPGHRQSQHHALSLNSRAEHPGRSIFIQSSKFWPFLQLFLHFRPYVGPLSSARHRIRNVYRSLTAGFLMSGRRRFPSGSGRMQHLRIRSYQSQADQQSCRTSAAGCIS